MNAVRHEITSFGPVPEWWRDVFFRRQVELRKRIRAMCTGDLDFTFEMIRVHCLGYEPREVLVALQYMVADGIVALVEGRYSLSMAGNNYSATSRGFYEAVPDEEIARRIEVVSQAKHRLQRDLTDDELDAIIEPTPCLRTRTRLRKKEGRDAG